MNFLLIPDGLRRFARRQGQSYEVNYLDGARKMFADVEVLRPRFKVVGTFPLASYNLLREPHEVEALLGGLFQALMEYVTLATRPLVVIGDRDQLLARYPRFADPLSKCDANPHLDGRLNVSDGAVVMYLCYDGWRYARELFERFHDDVLQDELLRWSFVFRTGCEHALFRYSALIPGTEQARVACSERLYQDVSVMDMMAPFHPWLE